MAGAPEGDEMIEKPNVDRDQQKGMAGPREKSRDVGEDPADPSRAGSQGKDTHRDPEALEKEAAERSDELPTGEGAVRSALRADAGAHAEDASLNPPDTPGRMPEASPGDSPAIDEDAGLGEQLEAQQTGRSGRKDKEEPAA
jgi:hypothetical protein